MRLRSDDTLDPDVERELAAIDAALAGEPLAPEHGELERLVRAARADRPRASDAFTDRLDARLQAGFDIEPHRRPHGLAAVRRRLHRRMLLPALGAAATLLVAIVVVASVVGGDEPVRHTSGPAPTSPVVPPASQSSRSAGEAVAPAPRRVERDASLTLQAPADRVDDVSQQVIHVTDGVDGVIANSSISSGDGSGGATFELRIPSDRLHTALARLSKLAHVRSRQEGSRDITDSYNAAKAELDQALAERSSLLKQLAAASTPNEAESIRARLRINRQQIAQSRRSVNGLRRRTNFATVQLTVDARKDAGSAGGSWTPDDALADAARILEVSLGVLVVALAVAVPMAAVLALAVMGARAARRRRREQALASG